MPSHSCSWTVLRRAVSSVINRGIPGGRTSYDFVHASQTSVSSDARSRELPHPTQRSSGSRLQSTKGTLRSATRMLFCENQVNQSCRSRQRHALVCELLEPEMPIPSGLLVEQSSVAKREGTESECLARNLVETGTCQLAVKCSQRIGMKPRLTRAQSGGSQNSPDPTLERFQSGIEDRIENLMKGPVVISRDDQVPARLQDAEDLTQRQRQRHKPLGHANQHDEIKRGISKRHIVDLTYSRGHARGEAVPFGHRHR